MHLGLEQIWQAAAHLALSVQRVHSTQSSPGEHNLALTLNNTFFIILEIQKSRDYFCAVFYILPGNQLAILINKPGPFSPLQNFCFILLRLQIFLIFPILFHSFFIIYIIFYFFYNLNKFLSLLCAVNGYPVHVILFIFL